MDRPHLRPHFDLLVTAPKDEVSSRLAHRFAEGGDRWAGHIVGDHVQLVIRRKQRHIWSPWLTLALAEEEAGTTLRGHFAPHPSGWTLYLALYGMVLIGMTGLGFFGLSQWMAGLPATALWSLPGGAVILLGLYASAFVGQRLSGEDMEAMRGFVLGAFEKVEHRWLEPENREFEP